MTKIFSIVGTDTDIGKTYATCQLLHYLTKQAFTAAALKPIASGLLDTGCNQDVLHLAKASSYPLTHAQINAFSFKEAIAPHIAASHENSVLNIANVVAATDINHPGCDYLLIEGIGGAMTPLNADESYLDLLIAWDYPIILIVGIKLGCLNHALLTEAALKKLNCIGWIANALSPDMPAYTENIQFLQEKLTMPLLATILYQGSLQITPHFNERVL